jgi:hypothetical protein
VRIEEAAPRIPVVFEGIVFDAHGAAAGGAVVACSAGGKAATDHGGRYRLETWVPLDAVTVQITATGSGNGQRAAARSVSLGAGSALVLVQPLELVLEGACEPGWLPTFGDPGSPEDVLALVGHDDGSGPALHVGGDFSALAGLGANNIGKWDGSSWNVLGAGLNDRVDALAAFDDGSGAALHAGGRFRMAGGMPANRVARWDGSSWSSFGAGLGVGVDEVQALVGFDDGAGPKLYAGGDFFAQPNGSPRKLARWNGSSWQGIGSNINGEVNALAVFDDGAGPALYVGGNFVSAGGVTSNGIARWDGSSWSALGSGMTGQGVFSLAVFDDGSGAALYAGGDFTAAGGVPASCIARWDGSSWGALGAGVGGTTGNRVFALTTFDDGNGPALYAGGTFTTAGGVAANHVARWDGSGWSPLGGGVASSGSSLPQVRALTTFNDRTGLALYVGGTFSTSPSGDRHLARWGCPDTTAPVITCPPGILVDDRPGQPGEILTFVVTAVDEEDPTPSLVCSPPSGSHFPRGTTLVVCTATDFAGNQATCQFLVEVGALSSGAR